MKEKLIENLLSDSNVSSRRDFMKKAGKLAIYTPPAIMLLMHPTREAIAYSPGKNKPGCNGGRTPYIRNKRDRFPNKNSNTRLGNRYR